MYRIALLLALCGACAHGRPADDTAAAPAPENGAAADTARGTVAVVGSTPFTRVVLKLGSGRPDLLLTGSATMALRRASGTEVWVSGTRTGRAFVVAEFRVRAVDGQPAMDGRLALDDTVLMLVTADGARHRVARPPAALRSLVGARVWVTGSLDRGPLTWGLLEHAH